MRNLCGSRLPSPARAALIALSTLGGFVAADSLVRLLHLARQAWLHPVLYFDSYDLIRPGDGWGPDLLGWIVQQHNEHRIVLQRLSSLIGERWLDLPPGAGGVPANVLLLIAISGTLAWLCHLLIRPRLTACCCWLICTILAWNPWQQENIIWEFQTPWFLISLIVLLSMAVQIRVRMGQGRRQPARLFAALAPWVVIFSSGQGLAAAISMAAAAGINDKRSGFLALTSTLSALLLLLILGYHKPPHHPAYGFDLTYLFNLGGNALPEGRGLVLLSFLLLSAWMLPLQLRISEVLILGQPLLFALLFALMNTLTRSGFGATQALSPRYSSYAVLALINLILVLVSRASDQPQFQVMVLTMTLVLTVPVADVFTTARWPNAQDAMLARYQERVKQMECAFRSRGKDCVFTGLWPIPEQPPSVVTKYFSGHYRLRGWHRQLASP